MWCGVYVYMYSCVFVFVYVYVCCVCMYVCIHACMNGWMDRWMDHGWMDGWMDGWPEWMRACVMCVRAWVRACVLVRFFGCLFIFLVQSSYSGSLYFTYLVAWPSRQCKLVSCLL